MPGKLWFPARRFTAWSSLLSLFACSDGAPSSKAPTTSDTEPADSGRSDSHPIDSATADSGAPDSPGPDSPGPTDTDSGDHDTAPVPPSEIIYLDGGDFWTFKMAGMKSLGESAAFLDDIWGDGLPEIVTSAFTEDGGMHTSIYIVDGAGVPALGEAVMIEDAARIELYGYEYSLFPYSMGDLDGDGMGDLMVSPRTIGEPAVLYWGSHLASLEGKFMADIEEPGDVYVYSTFGSVSSGSALAAGTGTFSEPSGIAVDVVMKLYSALAVFPAEELLTGDALVLDGSGDAIVYTSLDSGGAGSAYRVGFPAPLGDLDGDGLNELVLYSNGTDFGTRGEIFYGDSLNFDAPTYVEDADVIITPPPGITDIWNDFLVTTPLGDTTGDGIDDLIMSNWVLDTGGLDQVGTAFFWSGDRLTSPTSVDAVDGDVEFFATYPFAQVGESAADIGDVDGDERADFLLHGAGWEGEYKERPFVHLIRGSDLAGGGTYDVNHASVGFQSDYPVGGGSSGAYAGLRDLDGDGVNDLLIGDADYVEETSTQVGRLWFLSGSLLSF